MKKAQTARNLNLVERAQPKQGVYSRFDQIDGSHPWKTAVPEGMVEYPTFKLNKGNVFYFNYALAKEMGLLPQDHPHKMNDELEAKLIETFSLQIYNEYDQMVGRKIPAENFKANKYMATR